MVSNLIDVKDVQRTFRSGKEDVQALKGVSLSLKKGELATITGPSGSGKTTLINIIGGLDQPDGGMVHYKGINLGELSDEKLTELRSREVGYVFQSFALVDILSVYENVELPLRILGLEYKERRERVFECLKLVGLDKRSEHRAYELSGGEQQRVGIARGIVNNPSLVLADEPTGELNQEVAFTIMELFEKISKELQKTIVIVTHDQLVVEFVDNTYNLVDGLLMDRGEGEDTQ